jgi:hypothetical protein
MCVWDGTYTAPEDEREAMDQIPGWNDDAAVPSESRLPQIGERRRLTRPTPQRRKAA